MKYHVQFDIDLRRNPYKGVYIAVEGIDGSGKTTQVSALEQYFKKKERVVVITQEPTREEHVGKLIHRVLQLEIKAPSIALQYIFSADRAVNHHMRVIPALKDNKVVISSRCFWSAIPYGILDREEMVSYRNTSEMLLVAQGILSMYHQFIAPDYTFYLDISVDTAMKRISGMGKQKEIYEKRNKIEKIVTGYTWLLRTFPKEFTRIDGEQSANEVTARIIQHLESKIQH